MRAPSHPALLRRCVSGVVLLAAAGCADDGRVTAPAAAPVPTASPSTGGVVTPMSVGVPTCGPTVTSSDGTCLPSAGLARGHAYAMWAPDGQHDSCPQNVHDAYWTLGPDRKVYPTWHPPTVAADKPGAGCTFGHEHGRNPAGSALASWGLPFGYVNEYYAPNDPGSQRHEDHVGHKVDWENGWTFSGTRDGVTVTLKGDLLMKVHQGTHSRDALTNNLHEVFYYLRLTDGTELRLRMLNGFGAPGGFKVECSNGDPRGANQFVDVGIPTPANSPAGVTGGSRVIPSVKYCPLLVPEGQESNFYSLVESWQTGGRIQSAATGSDGLPMMLFHIDPYFQVLDPARVHTADPSMNFFQRTVDLCYATGPLQVRGASPCDSIRPLGRVAWNDPRSPFRGATRRGDVGILWFYNRTRTRVWYTTPFRAGGPLTSDAVSDRPDPATGRVIEQIVSPSPRHDLNGGVFPVRDFGAGHHVHAPN